MEGHFPPPLLPLRKVALPLIAAALLLPQTLFTQAMGQVTLDTLTSSVAGPPAPQSQVTVPTAPAVAATPTSTATLPEAKTAPLPTTTAPTAPEIKTPITPATLNEKPPVADTLPVEPTKAAAPVTPIRPKERQEIRPPSAAPGEASSSTLAAKSAPQSTLSSIFQVVAALAVVVGLIFLGKALAKKYVPSVKAATNGKGVIEVLARYPLSKNQSLVLVRIGSQIVTLNQGKDQSQSVLVINDPNEVAKIMGQIEGTSPKSIQAGFNRLLANARMDLTEPNPELAAELAQDDFESRSMQPENLDTQLEEMAAAKRQLMELRQQVRSVRDSLPR